jgi:acyl carrier protein
MSANIKVIELLARQLAMTIDEATAVKFEDKIVDDLGADSLDFSEITMAIEEEFGLSISEEDAAGLKTVRNVVEYVDHRTSNSRGGFFYP